MEIIPPTVSNSLCRTIVNTTQAPSAIGPYNQVEHFVLNSQLKQIFHTGWFFSLVTLLKVLSTENLT